MRRGGALKFSIIERETVLDSAFGVTILFG